MPAPGFEHGEHPSLPILATKRVAESVKFPFTAYSHAHDLLAIVTTPSEVNVFRLVSGQVAFTIKRGISSEVEVTAVAWKADGTCLSVGWSDGSFEIYDGGSGRSVHTTHANGPESDESREWRLYVPLQDKLSRPKEAASANNVQVKVETFGWMGHEVGTNSKRKAVGENFTTDDWYDDADEDLLVGTDMKSVGLMDLPRAIATLDVTENLPRLAAIPVSQTMLRPGPEGTKFSNQAATDAICDAQKKSDPNLVDSLVVGHDDGTVEVLVDETVKIGSLNIGGKPILHAAHPNSSSHVVLNKPEESGLQLSFIDLPLSTFSGPILPVIASNTKRIQGQLDYIIYTLRCIHHDYTSGIELPTKYVHLLEDDVDMCHYDDIVHNLYHQAMSGLYTHDLVAAWLTDLVKDTGLKRWEANVNTMYQNLSNHLFVNLIPALDRITVAITTLRGYARLHEGSRKFDVPPQQFSNILEHIDSLRLVAQRMQLIVQTEHKQFRAFIKWLRLQLDVCIAGEWSHSALETEEREVPGMDYALILAYIKDTLQESKLAMHIMCRPGMEEPLSLDSMPEMSYERSKEALLRLESLEDGEKLSMKDIEDPMVLLNIPALAALLMSSVREALQSITTWQSRMLVPPVNIPLNFEEGTTITDMQHFLTKEEMTETWLLTLSPSFWNQLEILVLRRGPSAPPQKSSMKHTFSDGTLLTANWLPHSPGTFLTLFRTSSGEVHVERHLLREDTGGLHSEVLHVFPAAFKAEKLVVGGRVGKVLGVVFGLRGREWRVLDLEAKKGADDVEEMDVEEHF